LKSSGRVTDATIASTSGDIELDDAALTAIREANLPSFPSTIRGDHLILRVSLAAQPIATPVAHLFKNVRECKSRYRSSALGRDFERKRR